MQCRSLLPTIALTFTLTGALVAQPKSALEFYDSTGTEATSRFGWNGNTASGNFFIETPGDGQGVKVQQGVISADGFAGDGSQLTNLPTPSHNHTVDEVTDLSADLDRKADTNHTHTIGNVSGLTDSLAAKAPGNHDHAASEITGRLDTSQVQYGAHMITGPGSSSGQVWKWNGTRGEWATDATQGTAATVDWYDITNRPYGLDDGDDSSGTVDLSGYPDRAELGDTASAIRSAVSQNAGNISTNASDISANTSSISTNAGDISTNTSNISSNDGDITSLQGGKADTSHEHSGADITSGTVPNARLDADLQDLADGTLSGGKIGSGIAADSITAGTLPSGRIGDGSITGSHIAYKTITNSDVSDNAAISGSKVSPDFRGHAESKFDALVTFYESGGSKVLGMFATAESGDSYFYLAPIQNNATVNAIQIRNSDLRTHFYGDITHAGSITATSDKRLKSDIVPLEDVLGRVRTLRGVSFRWKEKRLDNGRNVGVIAQDVETVFPDLVRENEEGVKSVNYEGLSAVLLEAVKEQQEIIEEQQKQISGHAKTMARREKRLTNIEERLQTLEGLSAR